LQIYTALDRRQRLPLTTRGIISSNSAMGLPASQVHISPCRVSHGDRPVIQTQDAAPLCHPTAANTLTAQSRAAALKRADRALCPRHFLEIEINHVVGGNLGHFRVVFETCLCVQPLASAAVNRTLLAFAAERRAAPLLLLSAGRRLQQSIDISCPPGAQQQTHRRRTDRRPTVT